MFSRLVIILALLATTASAITSSFQEDVSPTAAYTQDAVYIRENQATTNQNNDPDFELLVGYTNDDTELRALLEFDIRDIHADDQIDAASLVLHTGGGLSASITINVYEYDHDFDETTSTWNAPGTGDGSAGGTLGTLLTSATFNPTVTDFITFPDTTAFQTAIEDALAGDGFLRLIIARSDSSGAGTQRFARFRDEAHGTDAQHPQLQITHSAPASATSYSFQEGVAPTGAYTQDAVYIRQNQATTNQNGDPDQELIVGFTGTSELRGLLEFDISSIAAGPDILSSTLTLHTGGGLSSSIRIDIYQYDFDFDETTSTWNTPGTGDGTPGGTKGSLLSSAVFDPSVATSPGSLVTLPSTAAFRSSIASALASDGFLRLLVARSDSSGSGNRFARFRDETITPAANRPALTVLQAQPPRTVFRFR
jgi:hypothetical protein